jgi:Tfp pilus assembly protein PilF
MHRHQRGGGMSKTPGDDPRSDLSTAISLAWGCLKIGNYAQAECLLKGCLRIWPDDSRLLLLQAYTCVEQGGSLTPAMLAHLQALQQPWVSQLLRRHGAA